MTSQTVWGRSKNVEELNAKLSYRGIKKNIYIFLSNGVVFSWFVVVVVAVEEEKEEEGERGMKEPELTVQG